MDNGTPLEQARRAYRIDLNRPLRPSSGTHTKLLHDFHPDYASDSRVPLKVGINRNTPCHPQLAELLQSESPTNAAMLSNADQLETDVLVIGAGGAGCAAALLAAEHGANVLIATKLRVGDSNTIMAEGGIQASVELGDTPQAHFDETLRAGHDCGNRQLVAQMVQDGPEVIQWLMQQGMQFDRNQQGDLATRRAGGTSADRVLHYRDYTGLEMMRVLREAVFQHPRIKSCDYSPAVELLSNSDGHCSGALLYAIDTERYIAIKANAVILASGGLGRMHLNGFPTSNHVGATGDGLVLAYRLGAKLQGLDSFQYHPTGLAWPHTLAGTLITEGIRGGGAQLVNSAGERFIDELAPRDVVSAAIIRECREGRGIRLASGRQGVWLDTPVLAQQHAGMLAAQFPKFIALCEKAGIDPDRSPLLICPTLHYQNGGVVINTATETTVPGLYCAGEVSGGIHGKNRIMGNALLEIISFGRRAGIAAAARPRSAHHPLTLNHLQSFHQAIKSSHITSAITGPLLFPHYARFSRKLA